MLCFMNGLLWIWPGQHTQFPSSSKIILLYRAGKQKSWDVTDGCPVANCCRKSQLLSTLYIHVYTQVDSVCSTKYKVLAGIASDSINGSIL